MFESMFKWTVPWCFAIVWRSSGILRNSSYSYVSKFLLPWVIVFTIEERKKKSSKDLLKKLIVNNYKLLFISSFWWLSLLMFNCFVQEPYFIFLQVTSVLLFSLTIVCHTVYFEKSILIYSNPVSDVYRLEISAYLILQWQFNQCSFAVNVKVLFVSVVKMTKMILKLWRRQQHLL